MKTIIVTATLEAKISVAVPADLTEEQQRDVAIALAKCYMPKIKPLDVADNDVADLQLDALSHYYKFTDDKLDEIFYSSDVEKIESDWKSWKVV